MGPGSGGLDSRQIFRQWLGQAGEGNDCPCLTIQNIFLYVPVCVCVSVSVCVCVCGSGEKSGIYRGPLS